MRSVDVDCNREDSPAGRAHARLLNRKGGFTRIPRIFTNYLQEEAEADWRRPLSLALPSFSLFASVQDCGTPDSPLSLLAPVQPVRQSIRANSCNSCTAPSAFSAAKSSAFSVSRLSSIGFAEE